MVESALNDLAEDVNRYNRTERNRFKQNSR
jgi:hypothetical protein